MKSRLSLIFCCLFTSGLLAQEIEAFPKGDLAPNVHHTGKVWLNFLSQANDHFPYNMVLATMEAGAKLDWHRHEKGQQLVVTAGIGFYQERGKEKVILKAGDIMRCSPGTTHWHGASEDQEMVHLAMTPTREVVWLEAVSDEVYTDE